jgi:hypothetical protein
VALAQPLWRGGHCPPQRYRQRTVAMAAGLTSRRWSMREVLLLPLPPAPISAAGVRKVEAKGLPGGLAGAMTIRMGGAEAVLEGRIRVKQACEAARIGASELSTMSRHSTLPHAFFRLLTDWSRRGRSCETAHHDRRRPPACRRGRRVRRPFKVGAARFYSFSGILPASC